MLGNVLQEKDISRSLRLGHFSWHVRDLKVNYAESIVNTPFRKETVLGFTMESAIHGLFREPDSGNRKLTINEMVAEIAKIQHFSLIEIRENGAITPDHSFGPIRW
jgi:hypothetical protein